MKPPGNQESTSMFLAKQPKRTPMVGVQRENKPKKKNTIWTKTTRNPRELGTPVAQIRTRKMQIDHLNLLYQMMSESEVARNQMRKKKLGARARTEGATEATRGQSTSRSVTNQLTWEQMGTLLGIVLEGRQKETNHFSRALF